MDLDFHVVVNGKVEGPFTPNEIGDLHGAGIVTKDTKCRRTAEKNWQTIDDLVPTAKWVTTPRGEPLLKPTPAHAPRMAGAVSVSSSAPDMLLGAIIAGWVCVAVVLGTFLLALVIPSPFLLTPIVPASIVAMLVGAATVMLGNKIHGIAIIVVTALVMLVGPTLVINRGIQEVANAFGVKLP